MALASISDHCPWTDVTARKSVKLSACFCQTASVSDRGGGARVRKRTLVLLCSKSHLAGVRSAIVTLAVSTEEETNGKNGGRKNKTMSWIQSRAGTGVATTYDESIVW